MNSVRRLTVVGVLTIGALRLEMPTVFAADIPDPCRPDNTCTLYAPSGSGGYVTYYRDSRKYSIYNPEEGRRKVGVEFSGKNFNSHYDSCQIEKCPNRDLPERVKGWICMRTKEVSISDESRDYQAGSVGCFNVDPPK